MISREIGQAQLPASSFGAACGGQICSFGNFMVNDVMNMHVQA